MHQKKLQPVRLRRQPRTVFGPRRRIGEGHYQIESDRVVDLPLADPFERLVVLHEPQVELPRQRIIVDADRLLEQVP